MAKIISLRLGGGMFDLAVKAVVAVKDEDDDTALKNVCCGTEPPAPDAPRMVDVMLSLALTDKQDPPTDVNQIKSDAVTAFDAVERYPGGPHVPLPPKQTVRCATCGTERTSWFGWPKGHPNDDGTFTVPDQEVLAAAAEVDDSVKKNIDLTLHNLVDVDKSTLRSGRVYYLEPGKDGAVKYNAYVGVVQRLATKGKAFCCMYAVSTAPAMYRLGVIDGVLMFEELAKPESVRLRPAINFAPAADTAVDLLEKLAEMSYGEFDPANYSDKRKVLIAAAIAAGTAEGAPVATAAAAPVKTADPFAALAALLGQTAPVVSDPAATMTVVDTPKKRAPARKKAAPAAEKIPA